VLAGSLLPALREQLLANPVWRLLCKTKAPAFVIAPSVALAVLAALITATNAQMLPLVFLLPSWSIVMLSTIRHLRL
jgi:hypothetical protein